MSRGAFIVLEGLDGAGTTTQCAALARHLREQGRRVHVTAEPSAGPIGTLIRQALGGRLGLPGQSGPLTPETMALLFAADRVDHLAADVDPALARGDVVLSDRYLLSSLAYQGAQVGMTWVERLNRAARQPDLTLFLDIDVAVAGKRRHTRGGRRELYETTEIQRATARHYRTALANRRRAGERVVVVPGALPVDQVTARCLEALRALRLIGSPEKAVGCLMADAAAGIIIGNEVLTAKVQDLNGGLLARKLRAQGVPLVSLHTVADDVDAIVQAVSMARRSARWVFTSGGIGPTHDDVTVRAVALALGRRIVRTPAMIELVNSWWKGATPPAEAMRFAEAPEGAELLPCEEARFPVLVCDGVHMLPGIPRLFERQLATALKRLPSSPVELKVLFLSATEADIARVLDEVSRALPHVSLGSYPAVERECEWKVKLTVEHREAVAVADAVERLRRGLPAGSILRVE